jgi:hypothetical protein
VQKARSRHRLVEHGKAKSFLIEPGWSTLWSNLPDAKSTARSVAKTDYSAVNWFNARKSMRFNTRRSGATTRFCLDSRPSVYEIITQLAG